MWRGLASAVHRLWFYSSGGELYRRERYYLRGRGPKWHAKYAQCASFPPPSRVGSQRAWAGELNAEHCSVHTNYARARAVKDRCT